jgi:uncharacterized surface protein with fasciclin (FAS1) repeats
MKKLITALTALTFLGMMASTVSAYNHGHEAKDIVATASDNADFSTLVTALQTAGLVEPLQGEGPFTVFAPTNAAFDALPEGALEGLLEEENRGNLAAILAYHVVNGQVMSGDIPEGTSEVPTAQGTTLRVEKTASGVTVNGANVTSVDIETSNGVIHVIDAVVVPGQ